MCTNRKTPLLVRHGLLLWLFVACVPGVQAGSLEITTSFGTHASLAVKSIRELKFQSVVRQQHDFSCGSAALATLLTYHYQEPVSEQEILLAMYERGDKAMIQKQGFSLLDMKQYLDGRGYRADGVYAGLTDLARVGVPAIVLIEDKGYKHFVVIKGVKNGFVLVGDPAAGLKRFRRDELEKLWTNGILFVVRSRADVGKSHFNLAAEWSIIPDAPIGDTVGYDNVAAMTLLRRPLGDF